MRLSDLQGKDVVEIINGKKIGNIIDIIINEHGSIESLIVEKKKIITFLSSDNDLEVKWDQINKIGEDVILVNLIK